ncbi:Gene 36 protein (modular protein) [uncultured Mycobacterium sp.]|uniref:Gene 36 protein (Modular protein) n=1 Tax=uncultured Mycobacterium sp. TaxID=171292 RepID=A0A1Y5PF07_9MYCO|nr:Gene 36 protein (modular protein) [uncultured Mycobacterium sp.]
MELNMSDTETARRKAPGALPKYITIAETADMLGVTKMTIRNMLSDGRLRGYRLGKVVRLQLAEVEAAMAPFGGAA